MARLDFIDYFFFQFLRDLNRLYNLDNTGNSKATLLVQPRISTGVGA